MPPAAISRVYLASLRNYQHRDPDPLHLLVREILEAPDRLLGGISPQLQELVA